MLNRAFLVLAIILAAPARAEVAVDGQIAALAGSGWQIVHLNWEIRQTQAATTLTVHVGELRVDALERGPIRELKIDCTDTQLSSTSITCRQGHLDALWNDQQIAGAVTLQLADGQIRASLGLSALGGTLQLDLEVTDQPEVALQLNDLGLLALLDLAPGIVPETITVADAARVGGTVTWQPESGLAAQLSVSGLSFDSSDGTLAGAELRAGVDLSLDETDGWRMNLALESGELLLDPLYLSFTNQPLLQVMAQGQGMPAGGLQISRFEVTDGEAINLDGNARLDGEGALTLLEVNILQLSLPTGFDRYLAPVTESLGAAGLKPTGQVLGQVRLVDGALDHLTMDLTDFGLGDARERYGARSVTGLIDYDANGDSLDSTLSWGRLRYYSLVIGAAEARFFAGGGQFSLLSALFLPILDGGLQVHELNMSQVGQDDMSMDFRGDILPMSLARITEGLGWPIMEGRLSGEIPAVRLRDQVVEVGGAVNVDVFDGEITISQLRLERIFGVLPTLAADIRFDNIDLEQMTGAFSFGRIEGRLDGRVNGLRLLDWRPVAFDLALYTDPDAKGKRKISQRAVDNLSSIGGGIAALSQTVLRFFDDFSYRRLGLSCRLVNDTCFMGGVGAAGNGYYLVEGSGIPRIDVKGFARQVDWPQLLARLEAATRSGGATIQ